MVPPIPVDHRQEIVRLRDEGHSFRDIREILLKKGLKYSVIGIGNCYQKIVKNGSVEAQPKQKYSKEMLDSIKRELQNILESNSDLTGQQQIAELKKRLGVTVSMDAVGRYRRLLGWKVMPNGQVKEKTGNASTPGSRHHPVPKSLFTKCYVNVTHCHNLRNDLLPSDLNNLEIINVESISKAISDGYTSLLDTEVLKLETAGHLYGPSHVFTSSSFIKYGPEFKYQVWAGISFQGASSICIWDGNSRIRANFYCSTILEKFFLPFRAERYPFKRCILIQNNGPICRANETKEFMQANELECDIWMADQATIPVLTFFSIILSRNPMDTIWEEINLQIREEVKPNTLDELREAICTFWATKMTDSKCRSVLLKCPLFSPANDQPL
uniref:Transposase n=1 Tax=Ditylenchus dipsaci TaxID=166011 RepID=A0A915D7T6_9BILA